MELTASVIRLITGVIGILMALAVFFAILRDVAHSKVAILSNGEINDMKLLRMTTILFLILTSTLLILRFV